MDFRNFSFLLKIEDYIFKFVVSGSSWAYVASGKSRTNAQHKKVKPFSYGKAYL
jgi:hypothetical protein